MKEEASELKKNTYMHNLVLIPRRPVCVFVHFVIWLFICYRLNTIETNVVNEMYNAFNFLRKMHQLNWIWYVGASAYIRFAIRRRYALWIFTFDNATDKCSICFCSYYWSMCASLCVCCVCVSVSLCLGVQRESFATRWNLWSSFCVLELNHSDRFDHNLSLRQQNRTQGSQCICS